MSEALHDDKLPYAERIAKLLRKAETTTNEAEAEAYTAKAQELMVHYAISEELLAQAQGHQRQAKIVETRIEYTGIYQSALYDIGSTIAHVNSCRCLISKRPSYGKNRPAKTILYVIGFEDDVERTRLLDASVQLQATTAMRRFYRNMPNKDYLSGMEKYKARREFYFGFADGVGAKLRVAARAGQRTATDAEAHRTGDAAGAARSTELVLRTKTERVNNWVDQTYGKLGNGRTRRYSSGGYAARAEGAAAGQNADVGQPRVGGGRRAIGR